MQGQFPRTPSRIGKQRGTLKNLKNRAVRNRNRKSAKLTSQKEATLQEIRYNKVYAGTSNLAWMLCKSASCFTPIYIDPDDPANNIYSARVCEFIVKNCIVLSSNPHKTAHIFFKEEWEKFLNKEKKYRLPTNEALKLTLTHGSCEADDIGERAPRIGGTAGSNMCLAALMCLLLISGANAAAPDERLPWYSVSVPFNERNIANNIGRVSDSLALTCSTMAAVVAWTNPLVFTALTTCTAGAAVVSSTAAVANASIRLIDHHRGAHPLTPAQVTSLVTTTGTRALITTVGVDGLEAIKNGVGDMVRGSAQGAAIVSEAFAGRPVVEVLTALGRTFKVAKTAATAAGVGAAGVALGGVGGIPGPVQDRPAAMLREWTENAKIKRDAWGRLIENVGAGVAQAHAESDIGIAGPKIRKAMKNHLHVAVHGVAGERDANLDGEAFVPMIMRAGITGGGQFT